MYKDRLSLAHSFALTGAGASVSPRTGERRERRAVPPGGSNPSPSAFAQGYGGQSNPLPLAKGRGETNGMGLTTGAHYRSHRIALKSYCQSRQQRAILKIYYAMAVKSLNTSLLYCVIVVGTLLASPIEGAAAQSTTGSNQSGDSSWPREKFSNGTKLIVYQPQVDDWQNFQDLSWRMAISLTPKSGKTVIGVVEMKGNTSIDNVSKLVLISNPQVTGTYFPSVEQATKEKMEQLFKSFVPSTFEISLHNLIASTPKKEAPAGVQLNNDPPKIFVGYRPSILLSVNGDPVLSAVPNTNLQFVANTEWPLFLDESPSTYYLAVGQQWLTASKLDGQWSATKKLPPEMSKVPQDKQWSALKKFIPPPANTKGVTPDVFYSDKPAEIILFDGQPAYAQIPNTQLEYATNTSSVVFQYKPTNHFYYLTAGRWFSAADLKVHGLTRHRSSLLTSPKSRQAVPRRRSWLRFREPRKQRMQFCWRRFRQQ